MKVYKFIFLLFALILLSGIVVAQLPPPPPAPPNMGGQASSSTMDLSDEELDALEAEILGEEFFEEETEPVSTQQTPRQTTSTRQTEPTTECPAANGGLIYSLATLSVILIIILGIILFMWKKDKESFIPAHREVMDTLVRNNASAPIQPVAQPEPVQPIRFEQPEIQEDPRNQEIKIYIDQCRAQGFDDNAIKFELLKHGYSADILGKFFNN